MPKRFRDTKLSKEQWYRKLSPIHKCVWNFLCDECDAVGVWNIDTEAMEFFLGEEINLSEFLTAINKDKDGRVEYLGVDKLFIPGFIEFQYGMLSKECKPHLPIIKMLEKYNLSHRFVETINEQGHTVKALRKRLTQKLQQEVFIQDDFQCQYCGDRPGSEDLVVDHIVALAKGGNNSFDNLTTSCIHCNSRKSDLSVFDFLSRHNITPLNSLTQKLQRVFNYLNTLEDKEEGKDKEEEKEEGGSRGKRKPNIKPDHENQTEEKRIYREEILPAVEQSAEMRERKRLIADFIVQHKPLWIHPYGDLWNLAAQGTKLSQIVEFTESRQRKFSTRVREPAFDFLKILEGIRQSPHLQGQNRDGWKADWDWIMGNDTNYLKILEGKYK